MVESLDNLLADMETFKNRRNSRTVPIILEKDNDIEKKVDNLTDKLIESFSNDDIKWISEKESLGEHISTAQYKTLIEGECKSCGEKIFEEGIQTGDDMYHQECFKCAHCGQRFATNNSMLHHKYHLHKDLESPSSLLEKINTVKSTKRYFI